MGTDIFSLTSFHLPGKRYLQIPYTLFSAFLEARAYCWIAEENIKMTGPILLAAIVGSSVSFMVVVFFNLLRERQGGKRSEANSRSRDTEVWE
jgi:hypothetical protein